jgi:flagellar basal-body rod protein FlgC
MDFSASFQISATGMALEKLRLDVTAANLANMHSTAATPEELYRPLRVVSRQMPLSFAQQFTGMYAMAGGGVQASGIEPLTVTPRLVHEPGHPHADDRGFVAYPGVNHSAEMLNMVSALRAYEANVVAMNAAKTMAARTLDIGGQ